MSDDDQSFPSLAPEIQTIIQLRQESRLTQSELAKEVGVSQAYIARIERGTLDPKLSVASRIISVLKSRIARLRYQGRFRNMLCSEIMSEALVTIDARDPTSRAVSLMLENNFSQLPVLRGNSIVGMITERDIIKDLHHDLTQISVQAAMTQESPPIVTESTPVTHVVPLLLEYQAILVQNQGRLSGIITRANLLKPS
ncbi:MAG: CBS domain-containing protein [Candidatus Thorarchaeota archaeon]